MGRFGAGVTAAALIVSAAGCEPAPTAAWDSELVSANAAGTLGATGRMFVHDISTDGTKVLFGGLAPDLGFPDSNPSTGQDAYVRDLVSGTVVRITTSSTGDGSNGTFSSGRFTPDGTGVVFATTASNLGPSDTNNLSDVYSHDLTTGENHLLSVNAGGTGSGNGASTLPVISPDGNHIAFQSNASNLGPADTNGASDVYIRDLVADTTELVSVDVTGSHAGGLASNVTGGFNADGTRLAFGSLARDLVPVSPSASNAAYVRDLAAGTTTLVSVASDGGVLPGNGAAQAAALSPDGTEVAFEYLAPDPSVFPPLRKDIYLRDLTAGTTSLVAPSSGKPAFAPDGSAVVFESAAGILVSGDGNGQNDVFLYRVATGAVELVSTDASGAQSAAGASANAVFSADGSVIGFTSSAPNVVSTYPATGQNLYLRHIADDTTELVSLNEKGDAAAGGVDAIWRIAADGATIAYSSGSKTLDRANPAGGTTQVYAAHVVDFAVGDLSVAVTTPSEVTAGTPATTTIEITNAGPEAVSGVLLRHVVTVGYGPVAATATAGTCTVTSSPAGEQIVDCALGTLGTNAAATVTVTATVTAAPGATLGSVSHVKGSRHTDPGPGENTATASTSVIAPP
jgi:Tol biopolymer transport system component